MFGYLDKNAGACTIECPILQWLREKRAYYEDTEHFARSVFTDTQFFQCIRSAHVRHNWKRFAPFPSGDKHKCPYGYVFQKKKSALKDRKIVSYWVHPLKRIYNYGSRALAFLLRESGMKSFTLWKTQDITPSLRAWYAKMGKAYGPHTRVLTACADAKEMYTAIPHGFLARAIEFIVKRCRNKNRRARRGFVSVSRQKRGPIRFGRSPDTKLFVNLSFDDVLAIVMTDIRNCYFVSLGVWLLQVVGVPMGSPGSPTYAICLCAFSEFEFHQSVHDFAILHKVDDWESFFAAFRYVDDILFLIIYDARLPLSKRVAESIIAHMFNRTYHENMIIEPEPSDGWFPFLEVLLNLPTEGPLRIRFNNKNWDEFVATGRIGLLTIQHRDSFMGKRDAVMKCYAILFRLAAAADTDFYRIAGALELSVLMRAQGYSAHTFRAALHLFADKTSNSLWKAVAKMVGLMSH